MAQATKLASLASSIHIATPISGAYGSSSRKRTSYCSRLNHCACKQIVVCQTTGKNNQESTTMLDRRSFGIATGAIATTSVLNTKEALAGKRKPAVEEENKPKDDPNMSGLQKKVIASIRRKEAMKESLAKLKERGEN
ncbi:uncharacterized protein LOC131052909 isoform X2 [Cryptomeria japonica]|uniref:uncharacterized protein LOC131052909 isoform X2 n=1 Tax=Cryptomeria japonica TaxID=3369 RepID=UPI0025ACEB17|nr:uncharacterized protein LOC131052909 isoform X2 [Cryptomeria japonica]